MLVLVKTSNSAFPPPRVKSGHEVVNCQINLTNYWVGGEDTNDGLGCELYRCLIPELAFSLLFKMRLVLFPCNRVI